MFKIICQLMSLSILSIIVSANLYASPFYQVEMIIFKQQASSTGNDIEPPQHFFTQMTRAHKLQSVTGEDLQAYNLLPSQAWTLNKQAATLEDKGKKQILFHKAWVQPILSSTLNESVYFQGGDINDEKGETLTTIDNFDPDGPELTKEESTELQGLLTLTQHHFIHVHLSLLYENPDNNSINRIYLDQHQRVKENELHYFDNHELGILLTIKPYSPPMSNP